MASQSDPVIDEMMRDLELIDLLDGAEDDTEDLQALGMLKPKMSNAQRAHFARLLKRSLGRQKLLKSRCGPLVRHYKGPISTKERRGTVVLPLPLIARFRLNAGPLGDTIAALGNNMASGVKLFHLGETNSGQGYGWVGNLTRYHTSFDKNGDLPQGWWFTCYGFEVTVEAVDGGEVLPVDLRIIGDGRARWLENGGSAGIPLPELRRMPPSFRVDQTRADAVPASVYFTGPRFRTRSPIFRIRGGRGETREMRIEWPDMRLALSQKYVVTVEAVGLMGVVPTVT